MWEEVSAEIEGTAHVVDDLLPGVTYIFRVSAINDVGMGHVSEPSEPVTIENNQEYDSDSPMFERIRMKTSPYDLEYQSEEELSRCIDIKYQRSCDLIILISPGASSPWWSNAERRRQTRCL